MKTRSFSSLLALILALAMVLSLSACGGGTAQKGADGSQTQPEASLAPDNGEASEGSEAGKSAYETAMAAYQSVLDEHPDAYFAFADMAEDQDILLLSTADEVFRPEEAYNATAATVYCVDGTGAVKELGTVVSGGSANPLAAVDGHLIYGGHKEMYKVHVDTAAGALVYDAGAQVRYDADEDATYYEGTDPDSMTEAKDSSAFDALLEEYGNAVTVEFNPVTPGAAEGGESAESSAVSMPNPVMQVDEAQQLEITGVTLNAPEGAEDVSRSVILEDEHPTAVVSFTYEGRTYDYRCKSTGELEAEDITGLYFDWTEEQKGEVQGREATIRTCDEAGSILWLDVVPGFTYSLSCGGSVDADTLSSVANLVFEELQGDA